MGRFILYNITPAFIRKCLRLQSVQLTRRRVSQAVWVFFWTPPVCEVDLLSSVSNSTRLNRPINVITSRETVKAFST